MSSWLVWRSKDTGSHLVLMEGLAHPRGQMCGETNEINILMDMGQTRPKEENEDGEKAKSGREEKKTMEEDERTNISVGMRKSIGILETGHCNPPQKRGTHTHVYSDCALSGTPGASH